MQWRRSLAWDPSRRGWRIAALFMVGALIFAVGSFPAYAQNVDPGVVGVTFVVGALFFTAAAYSQFVEVINDDRTDVDRTVRHWAWMPSRVLWWAAAVQFLGTVFFNFSTIDAMIDNLSVEQTNRLVWTPDFFGSVCFLIASHLGWRHVCGRLWRVQRDNADWWMAALNYLGSIFFMAAAIGAFTLDTGEARNITVVNAGTFAGASCFFLGAYLLLPATADQTTPQA